MAKKEPMARLQIRIPVRLMNRIKAAAKAEGQSLGDWCGIALTGCLHRPRQERVNGNYTVEDDEHALYMGTLRAFQTPCAVTNGASGQGYVNHFFSIHPRDSTPTFKQRPAS